MFGFSGGGAVPAGGSKKFENFINVSLSQYTKCEDKNCYIVKSNK
jgi:hypothetical protein